MLEINISNKILLIGPNYTENGGIASVVKSYKPFFPKFNFIPSYVSGSRVRKALLFAKSFLLLIYYCFFKDIKIVHIHTASYIDFKRSSVYVLVACFFRKKVVLHIHGGKFESFYLENKFLVKYVCKQCECLATVSMYFVNFLIKEKLNNKIYFLPNFIESPSITKNHQCQEVIKLLYMGRIDENKGVFNIIDVIAKYKSSLCGKIEFHIAGNGELEKLHKIIAEYHIDDLVIFHGWVDDESKKNIILNSDVYIQLSEFESFGLSILESMSYGLPVISTGVGGIVDLVLDGQNGIIVKRGDYKKIYDAIMFFYDLNNRVQYGEASIRISSVYFRNVAERRLSDMYNQLLNN